MNSLSEQDQLSVKLLRYDLGTELDALDLQTYLLRVGQMTGFHNSIYLTIDRMPRLHGQGLRRTSSRACMRSRVCGSEPRHPG